LYLASKKHSSNNLAACVFRSTNFFHRLLEEFRTGTIESDSEQAIIRNREFAVPDGKSARDLPS
jgi:hypothetical protein